MSADAFHFRVRNGNGWDHVALATNRIDNAGSAAFAQVPLVIGAPRTNGNPRTGVAEGVNASGGWLVRRLRVARAPRCTSGVERLGRDAVLFVGDEIAFREPVTELLGYPADLAHALADRAIWFVDAPAVKMISLRLRGFYRYGARVPLHWGNLLVWLTGYPPVLYAWIAKCWSYGLDSTACIAIIFIVASLSIVPLLQVTKFAP